MSPALSDAAAMQRSYDDRDVVHVPAAFSQSATGDLQAALWADAEARFGLSRHEPTSWPSGYWTRRHERAGAVRTADVGLLATELPTPAVTAALDAVLGEGGWSYQGPWSALTSGPERPERPWTLTDRGWHWDDHPDAGCQLFATFADLPPRSGGTLIVEGSGGLLAHWMRDLPPDAPRKANKLWKHFLASDPFLRRLSGRDRVERDPDDLLMPDASGHRRLAVTDVAGDAGHVVICRSGILHAAAVQTGPQPRFMAVRKVAVGRDGPHRPAASNIQ